MLLSIYFRSSVARAALVATTEALEVFKTSLNEELPTTVATLLKRAVEAFLALSFSFSSVTCHVSGCAYECVTVSLLYLFHTNLSYYGCSTPDFEGMI